MSTPGLEIGYDRWALYEDGYNDLPYHGKPHPLRVREVARELVALCQEQGMDPDEEIVEHVVLAHDVGYANALDKDMYKHKEERSAKQTMERNRAADQAAQGELWMPPSQQLWLPTRKLVSVYNGIIRTHFAEDVVTLEDVIENRADIDNTGQDYVEEVAPSAFTLLVERRYLAPEPIPFETWRKETDMVLSGYEDKNLLIGDFDVNNVGRLWVSAMTANKKRLMSETEASLREIVGEEACAELEDRYPAMAGYALYGNAA